MKAKFKVGQAVRMVAIFDVWLPCYGRVEQVERLEDTYRYKVGRMEAGQYSMSFSDEKYLRPLTKREAGR